MTVAESGPGIGVEVADCSSPGTQVLRRSSHAEGGRGLGLTEDAAARWGCRQQAGRTTTWFGTPDSLPRGGPGLDLRPSRTAERPPMTSRWRASAWGTSPGVPERILFGVGRADPVVVRGFTESRAAGSAWCSLGRAVVRADIPKAGSAAAPTGCVPLVTVRTSAGRPRMNPSSPGANAGCSAKRRRTPAQ